jgi:outer membrane lipoprotein-sorting protein
MSRLFLLAVAPALVAQDARDIVAEAQKRARSTSQRYEGVLQVIDASNKITEKRWTYDRIGDAGNSKVVLRFTAPPEVKGVALLVVNHPDRASDQWMWTPAIARERRIALQDRSTRFFGTDFSFEDLEERDVDQFDYKILGEETVDNAACWKIESRPKRTKASQYSHSHLWIRKDYYVFVRADAYQKDQLIRRIVYGDLEKIQGIWTPRRLEVTDQRRKSRTVMRTEKVQYNLPMKDEDFTLQALRRES